MSPLEWLDDHAPLLTALTGLTWLGATLWVWRRKKRSIANIVFYYTPAIGLMAAVAWTSTFTLGALTPRLSALSLFQVLNAFTYSALAVLVKRRLTPVEEERRRRRGQDAIIITHLLTRAGPVTDPEERAREEAYIRNSDLKDEEKVEALRLLTEGDTERRKLISERLSRRLEKKD